MQQFKLKPSTKKSSTNITSANNIPSISEKRLELHQNNDLINLQQVKASTEQNIGQSMEMGVRNPPNLLRNSSLRPRSGVSRNLGKTSKAKNQKSDQEMIQQRIRQKLMANHAHTTNTIGQRPSTSGLTNDNSGIRYEKKQKLMNRRTINSSNGVKTKTIAGLGGQEQEDERFEEEQNSQYVSNQQALQIMLSIIDEEAEYKRLKQSNQQQFQKIREKLLSHVSIIVLKWYKILQDQLYHEVKNLGAENTSNNNNVPSSIQELICQQIKRQFSKESGLFVSQQRCSLQQDKLAKLIDNRLERLEGLLVTARGK